MATARAGRSSATLPIRARAAAAAALRAPERRWRRQVLALAAGALLVRLTIIAVRASGGFNLRVYWWFAHLAAHGHNPYHAPAGGPVAPGYANNPPLEMLLFAGLLLIHDSPTTLRLALAAAEAAMVALIGLRYPREREWRAALCLFLAFNPFLLLVWSAFTSDKVLVVALLAAVLAALARDQRARAWILTTLLAALKWVGLFYAPALALDGLRRGLSRRAAAGVALLAASFLALSAPWFPSSLEALQGRNSRIDLRPIHAALTELLARAHLYSAALVRPAIVAAIVVVLALQWRRALSVAEAIVLCVVAAFLPLPDGGVDRVMMLTVALLLVVELSPRRWLAIWALSVLQAVAFVIQQVGPAAGQEVIGNASSIGAVLLMNPMLLLVLYWLIADRLRGVPRPGEATQLPASLDAPHRRSGGAVVAGVGHGLGMEARGAESERA